MLMKQIDDLILTGLEGDKVSPVVKYAKAYGRCSAILEGVALRMSKEEREEFLDRLKWHSKNWKQEVEDTAEQE